MPDTLDYARPLPGEATERANVTVVFLRMPRMPERPPAIMPPGVMLTRERLSVPDYRRLYNDVGTPWLWWLRRLMPDAQLARHLAKPSLSTYVLRVNGKEAGFFETDASHWPFVNLNYFGIKPEYIGRGLGRKFLDAAVDSVFIGASSQLAGMTVNTCSADHPRALPNYIAAGFVEYRRAREEWDIPTRLGLTIPGHLRG